MAGCWPGFLVEKTGIMKTNNGRGNLLHGLTLKVALKLRFCMANVKLH